jgi:hypothetical protein
MSPFRARPLIVGLAVAVVAGAVVAGLIVAGSPAEERLRRLDERRVRDLRSINEAINAFTKRDDRLPASLEELVNHPESSVTTEDPQGVPYGYRPLEALKYELCAEFQRPTGDDDARPTPGPFWRHPAGRHCFALEAEAGNR